MNIITGAPCYKWSEVEAVQHEPFIYITSNGSHWADSEPDDIKLLLNALHRWTLDPTFEDYGNFITVNPCRGVVNPKFRFDANPPEPQWINGPRLFEADVTMFHGNFYGVSHVFNIYTNDPDTIEALTKAIRDNQASQEYIKARATCGEGVVWGRKTLEHTAGNRFKSDLGVRHHG